MEQLDDQELLIQRNAKKHFKTCLNQIDEGDLLKAIAAIEKASDLQPDNVYYYELTKYLKDLLFSRMGDSYRSSETSTTSNHYDKSSFPEKDHNDIDSTNILRNSGKASPNEDEKNSSDKENSSSGKCSQCHCSCEEKHSVSGSEIPMDEKPEQSKPTVSDHEEEELQNSDCNKPYWFPNPAKYNIDGFDVDAKFFEEVCKQRESADCWDTYMKLLSDKSQDDDDDDDSDVISDIDNSDDNVQTIGSFNDYADDEHHHHHNSTPVSSSINTHERTKEFTGEIHKENGSNSHTDSSYEGSKTNTSSENSFPPSTSPNKAPKQEEKERLYFVNGKGHYGIPPSTSENTSSIPTNSKPTNKPRMDTSQDDFYKNLRFYFTIRDTMPSKRTTAATSQGDSSKPSSGSAKQHVTSDGSETKPSKKEEDKENAPHVPPKVTSSTEPSRNTSSVGEEKPLEGNTIPGSSLAGRKSKKVPVKGAEKAQVPKRGNSSDRRGKKVNKSRGPSQGDGIGPQTRTKMSKKNKQKFAGSAKENEQDKELKKKISNSSENSELKEWTWHTGKRIFYSLLWSVCYALIILLIILVFLIKGLYKICRAVLTFLVTVIMSWRISVIVKDKLSIWKAQLIVKIIGLVCWLIGTYYSCKSRCIRWYIGIRTLGFREFLFGASRRTAQTYNLPNSGEDAIEQLLLKRNSDPYSILGVPKEASNDDIRKQYRRIAVLVHPDKNPHSRAAEAFRVLSGAYDIVGDPEKRFEFDREVERRQTQSTTGQNAQRDFTNPRDVIAEILRQMEEIRESLSCDVCGKRHRRILTERDVIFARHCYQCNRMHQAKEGDFWKESSYMGFGPSKFYARMEGRIYDISEWGQCQERNGFNLPSDSHQVLGKLRTTPQRRPPSPTRMEEEIWRDFFGGGEHENQSNKSRQQRSRRRKRR